MSDETFVVKIKSETVSEEDTIVRKHTKWGKSGKLVAEDENGKDTTYELNPILPFVVTAQALEVVRTGELPEEEGELPLIKTYTRVHGKVMLNGSLGVIGASALKTNILSLNIRAMTPSDPRVEAWKKREEDMPTAYVGFNRAQWESGTPDDWFAECYVSEKALVDIVSSIVEGRVESLEIVLHLQNIYTTDPYAPPGARARWFLRPNKRDNKLDLIELAHGVVKYLNLVENSKRLIPPDERDVEPEAEEEATALPAPTQERDSAADAIRELTVQVTALQKIGVWIVVAIIIAVVILKL